MILSLFLNPKLLEGRFSSGQDAFSNEVYVCLKEMLDATSLLKQATSYVSERAADCSRVQLRSGLRVIRTKHSRNWNRMCLD